MTMTRRSHGIHRRGVLFPLLALILAQSACMSTKAPERTGAMEAFGVEGSARKLRLNAQNMAHLYMSTVELAADSIIKVSRDPAIQYAALKWKANAIPAFQRAMYQADPLVSMADGWTLIVQMRQLYDTGGAGEDRFGPHQAIAVEPVRVVEMKVDSAAKANQPPEVYERFHKFVYDWAAAHPLNDLYLRHSVGEAAVTQLSDSRPEGLAQLGSLTEMAMDAQEMSVMLATYLPKEARWQSELLIASLSDTSRLAPLLAAVDSMAVLQALTELLEQTPEMIAEERAALFREISRERLAILENLELQRIETLEAAVDLINSEREETLRGIAEVIASERAAITDAIRESSTAMMDGSRGVIDHIVWRVVQVGAIFLLIAGAFTLFVLRRLKKI